MLQAKNGILYLPTGAVDYIRFGNGSKTLDLGIVIGYLLYAFLFWAWYTVFTERRQAFMKYPYMTLPDETEITHGDIREDGTVLVYIETPVEWGFNSAYCVLPSYEWNDVHGYTETEIARFDKLLHNNAHLIIELARAGGFENATAV